MYFIAKGEVIKFPGFMKLLNNAESDNGILPSVSVNEHMKLEFMDGRQKFKKPKSRFNEASLVKKLEELGIGQTFYLCTYNFGYSAKKLRGKKDSEGFQRKYIAVTFKNNQILETVQTENTGTEKRKLFPTDIGVVANDFLVANFQDIINYNFTAQVEKDFDNIASGGLEWNEMIANFYSKFNPEISKVLEHAEKSVGQRLLGEDPETGKNVYVRIGRYGPMVQIGDTDDSEDKPKFAGLQKNQKNGRSLIK